MNNLEVVEGNLKAAYDNDRENMWYLLVKNVNGGWRSVQWMHVSNIQDLFQTQLPVINK
jgi:hypothetical protein